MRTTFTSSLVVTIAAGLVAGCSALPTPGVPAGLTDPLPPTCSRPTSTQHTLNTAWSLAAEGRYANAEQVLARWLRTARSDDPARAKALFWMGWCQQRQGRPDVARRTYELLIERHPRSAAAAQAERRLERLEDPPAGGLESQRSSPSSRRVVPASSRQLQ